MNAFGLSRRRSRALVAVVAAIIFAALPMAASAAPKPSSGPTPIVLFPAWHFTRLEFRSTTSTRIRVPELGELRGPRRVRSRARRSRRSAATSC